MSATAFSGLYLSISESIVKVHYFIIHFVLSLSVCAGLQASSLLTEQSSRPFWPNRARV